MAHGGRRGHYFDGDHGRAQFFGAVHTAHQPINLGQHCLHQFGFGGGAIFVGGNTANCRGFGRPLWLAPHLDDRHGGVDFGFAHCANVDQLFWLDGEFGRVIRDWFGHRQFFSIDGRSGATHHATNARQCHGNFERRRLVWAGGVFALDTGVDQIGGVDAIIVCGGSDYFKYDTVDFCGHQAEIGSQRGGARQQWRGLKANRDTGFAKP